MAYYEHLPASEAIFLPRIESPYMESIWGTIKQFEDLYRASWLFSEGYHTQAGCTVRRAFLKLELYQCCFPQFLLFVMYLTIMYPIDRGVLLALWKYLAARAKIFIGKDPSIVLSLARLTPFFSR